MGTLQSYKIRKKKQQIKKKGRTKWRKCQEQGVLDKWKIVMSLALIEFIHPKRIIF